MIETGFSNHVFIYIYHLDAENYHAITGKGLRDPGFTWTASTFLLMAQQLHQKTTLLKR